MTSLQWRTCVVYYKVVWLQCQNAVPCQRQEHIKLLQRQADQIASYEEHDRNLWQALQPAVTIAENQQQVTFFLGKVIINNRKTYSLIHG